MLRPTTPIPNGCSFSLTLFNCQLNFANNKKSNQQYKVRNLKSDRHFDRRNEKKEKLSLKNMKSPMVSLRSIEGNISPSKISNSILQKQYDNFSQFSSVLGPKCRKNHIVNNRKAVCDCVKGLKSDYSTQRGTQRTSFRPSYQIKQNFLPNQYENNTQTNVFTDEITLNQQSGCQQLKIKQNISSIGNNSKANLRRVHTQHHYTEQGLSTVPNIANQKVRKQNNKRPNPQVTRSQFIHSNNIHQLIPSVTLPSTNHIKKSQTITKISNQTPGTRISDCYKQQMPKSGSASNHNLITPELTSRNNLRNLNANSPSPIELRSSNHGQVEVHNGDKSNFHLIFNESNSTHMRRISSPRFQFEKKFKTLVDLSCKNVSSSGGQKTSSNHISIVASQDSTPDMNLNSTAGGVEFAKVIKMMTLKSMPLRQDIWSTGETR